MLLGDVDIPGMPVNEKKHLIAIIGPTASGKTALSLELAKKLNGAVISADSRQLYQGMDIGTAKVTLDKTHPLTPSLIKEGETNNTSLDKGRWPAIQAGGVLHHLINVTTPDQPWTLAQWQQAAFTAIEQTLAAGQTPLLVGGTMQYIDSIIQNWHIPEVPTNESLRTELAAQPVEQLFARLLEHDPAAQEFIEPHNKRRIIRALEVIEATGRPFSESRRKQKPRYRVTMLGLFPGWKALEKNIRQRSEQMFTDGLLAEVQRLQTRYHAGGGNGWHWSQTMNYRQPLAVLRGELSQEEAIASMVRDNLKYAKRQMRWLRPSKPRQQRGEVGWKTGDIVEWFEASQAATAVFASEAQ